MWCLHHWQRLQAKRQRVSNFDWVSAQAPLSLHGGPQCMPSSFSCVRSSVSYHWSMSANYTRKMSLLRARIFGKLLRPVTPQWVLYTVVKSVHLYTVNWRGGIAGRLPVLFRFMLTSIRKFSFGLFLFDSADRTRLFSTSAGNPWGRLLTTITLL